MSACRVKHIQFRLKRYPNPTPAVLENGPYFTARNGIWIERVRRKNFKAAAVVAVQPVLGSNPDEAIPALQDVEHHALRKAIRCGEQLIVGGGLGVQWTTAKEQQQDQCLFQTKRKQCGRNFKPFSENEV